MATKSLLAGLLAPVLLGCGSSESIVSGSVTVNGQPLQQGFITFFPTSGTKSACGAEVINGQYQAKATSPGPRRVVIAGTPNVQAVAHANGPTTLKMVPSANQVSPQARGNQQIVEIHQGKQTLNFTLENPRTFSQR
jgi:hypothetical protein